MKPTIRIAFRLFAAIALLTTIPVEVSSAQDGKIAESGFSGTVVYDETVKFDLDNLPPRMQRFRDRMEDSRSSSVVLIFNESTSLSQLAPETEPEEPRAAPNDRRNRRFRPFRQRENSATFVDFESDTAIQRREFLDRVFLVDGAPRPNWKLTGDESEFLGYQCHRAIAEIDTVLVEAWFTSEIPVPAGPDDYYGLPGLILVLTTDDGNRSYVATDVSLRAVDPDIIAAPTEGRQVSREEFDQIVAEKLEEQRAQRRARGQFNRRRQ